MNRTFFAVFAVPLAALAVASLSGCSDDARLARLAERASDRQAAQNQEMARVTRESAEATKQLVEADAQSRKELVSLQQDLRTDQAGVNEQRDKLEEERKAIVAHRHRDPIIANVLGNVGLVLACLLPLVLCWYLLRTMHDETADDSVVAEVLIGELASGEPKLLPPLGTDCAAVTHLGSDRRLLTANDDPAETVDGAEAAA